MSTKTNASFVTIREKNQQTMIELKNALKKFKEASRKLKNEIR